MQSESLGDTRTAVEAGRDGASLWTVGRVSLVSLFPIGSLHDRLSLAVRGEKAASPRGCWRGFENVAAQEACGQRLSDFVRMTP